MEKPDSYHPSLPHVVTVNGFQVLLRSIACLPSYPRGKRYLSYSPPQPLISICASSNLQITCKTPIPLLVPWLWVDYGPLFNIHSHLRWPALLTESPILINCTSLSFCLKSGNSFPTQPQATRKVTILLDLLKCVKQSSNLSMNSYLSFLFHWGSKSSFIEQNFQHY